MKLTRHVIWYAFVRRSAYVSNYPEGRVLTLDLVALLGDRNLELLKDSLRKGFEVFRNKGEVGEGRTSERRYRKIGDDDYETDTDSPRDGSNMDWPTPLFDDSGF